MANTDVEILWILVLLFAVVGFVTPFIAMEFGGSVATFKVDNLADAGVLGTINAITSVFAWTFGVPFIVNLIIFIPLRIVGYVLLYKLIRGF